MHAPNKREADAIRTPHGLTQSLRAELTVNHVNISDELKALKAWVLWEITKIDPNTGKFDKVPSYPTGKRRSGEQGSPEDRELLGTFDDVWAAFERNSRYAGIGLAMLPAMGYTAFDADKCLDASGALPDYLTELVDLAYAEISPSHTGIRAFWRGTAANGRNIPKGLELYSQKQFVTVTGNVIDNAYSLSGGGVPTLSDALRAQLEKLCQPDTKKATKSKSERLEGIASNDPVLSRLNELGMLERDMGAGKYSILCPFESEHSDPDRAGGDGDTAYLLPHTNGHATGHFHCTHSHCCDRPDIDFLIAIGLDPRLVGFGNIEDWPEPHPLPNDLPTVKPFDLSLLPDAFRPWIVDIAERMQIAPDIPAMGAITALSSVIGRRVQIMPKAHDDWTVVPNLWGLVISPPGFMKSPALSEIMRPLRQMEEEANRNFETEQAAWLVDKERVSIANSAAREKAKAVLKKDPDAPIPDTLPEPEQPQAVRYVVNNFSMEAIGEVMLGNPNGVLAFSDEIHGLL